jgi:hypothetical protein
MTSLLAFAFRLPLHRTACRTTPPVQHSTRFRTRKRTIVDTMHHMRHREMQLLAIFQKDSAFLLDKDISSQIPLHQFNIETTNLPGNLLDSGPDG